MTPTEIIILNIIGSLIGAGIPVAVAVYMVRDSIKETTEEMDVGEIMEEGMEALMGGMPEPEGEEDDE